MSTESSLRGQSTGWQRQVSPVFITLKNVCYCCYISMVTTSNMQRYVHKKGQTSTDIGERPSWKPQSDISVKSNAQTVATLYTSLAIVHKVRIATFVSKYCTDSHTNTTSFWALALSKFIQATDEQSFGSVGRRTI